MNILCPVLAFILVSSPSEACIPNGVLVTGGVSNNDFTQRKVELIDFRPNKKGVWTCPDLPLNYFAHTQDTLLDNKVLLCGGFDTSTRNFCRQMEKASFPLKPKHQFRTPWWDHISWTNKSVGSVFVLGGERTSNLTVFVVPSEFKAIRAAFDPPYPSRLSCSIFLPETSTVVVTGGRDPTMNLVLDYNEDGLLLDKRPSLKIGRYNHGCTSYRSGNDRVLIVTGGQKNQVELLDSTEILVPGTLDWKTVGPFPKKVAGLRLTNFKPNNFLVDGYVLSFGGDEGKDFGDKFLNQIFQFNIKTQEWEENTLGVKQMKDKRSRFGLSVVRLDQKFTKDLEAECAFFPSP